MTRPNFFIAGAPKCGTTSMYHYLSNHPRVFMPVEKEPHYFTTDMPVWRRMDTEEAYLELFADAGPEHLAVGEASVWYLCSKEALPLIRDFNPDARILVFFRNPVEFVQSLHAQFAYNSGRNPNFPRAWANPKFRGRLVTAGLFGQQLMRLNAVFPPEQIFAGLLEDLQAQPRQEYLRVLDFLGLEDDGRSDFSARNIHKIHRSPWISRFAKKTPAPLANIWQLTKRITGIRRAGIMDYIHRLNTRPVKRQAIDPALRKSIREEFAEDIAVLERQLQRDLSHWQ